MNKDIEDWIDNCLNEDMKTRQNIKTNITHLKSLIQTHTIDKQVLKEVVNGMKGQMDNSWDDALSCLLIKLELEEK